MGSPSTAPVTLLPRDTTTIDGIPCTTVARTLLDLADVIDRQALERACERAEILRVFDLTAINDVLARADGRRGASTLRAIIAGLTITLTRSELERLFLALCAEAGLPRPQQNVWIPLPGGDLEVDFLWPDRRLIVETDGWETHGTRAAFERDHDRLLRLRRAGYDVIPLTWRQVVHRPGDVVAALSSPGPRGTPRIA